MSVLTDLTRDAEKRGLITAPGFIDLHAHLREPGFEESETIATGALTHTNTLASRPWIAVCC